MSDTSQGPEWWQASDGRWYPPADQAPAPGWWFAADGKWYPPVDQAPAPGWWLASDGEWYPPVGAGESHAATAAPAKPVPAKPVPAKPVPAKPVPAKPVAATPVPAKPVPAKPVAAAPTKPVPAKPVPTKPVPAKPVAAKPVPAKPAAAAPKPAPAAAKPAAAPKPAADAPKPAAKVATKKTQRSFVSDTPAPPPEEDPIDVRNQQSQVDARMLAAQRAAAASRALASLAALGDEPEPTPPRERDRGPDPRGARMLRAEMSVGTAADTKPEPAGKTRPEPTTKTGAEPTKKIRPEPVAEAPAVASKPEPAPVEPEPSIKAASHGAPVAPLVTGAVGPRPTAGRPAPVQAPPNSAPAVISPPSPRAPAEPSDSDPLMEVKPTSLKADVDRIGDRLVVFKDRVELHDRSGNVRQSIRGDEITDVVVQKKFTGSAVTVESIDGTMIVAKGLRPEQSEEVRDLILRRTRRGDKPVGPRPASRPSKPPQLIPPPPETAQEAPAQIDAESLLAKLDDLHAAGVLTTAELDDKRTLVARLAAEGSEYAVSP